MTDPAARFVIAGTRSKTTTEQIESSLMADPLSRHDDRHRVAMVRGDGRWSRPYKRRKSPFDSTVYVDDSIYELTDLAGRPASIHLFGKIGLKINEK
jgi:hypothetical protein